MDEKSSNSELAQLLVSSNATSARQLDSDNTGQREIVETTMPQELNTLASRAMHGDEEAFNELFETFFSIAAGHAHKLPEYIREEFLLDMGQRLVACLTNKKWKDTGKPFEAWIHATAQNALREWWRIHKKRSAEFQDSDFRFEEIEDTDNSVLDQMLQQEEKAILWKLVTSLAKVPATVIYQHYACKKSFAEIGEQLGKTEANCRKIHQRALESLRQLIQASGYYPEKDIKKNKGNNH